MTTRRSPMSVLLGILLILLLLGLSGGYLFLMAWPMSETGRLTGQQILLMLWSPAILGAAIFGIWYGARRVGAGLTSYTVDVQGTIRNGPLHSRRIPWSDICDFALLPGNFPAPPRALALYPRSGEPIEIELQKLAPADVEQIAAWYPPLAEHGINRVKRKTPSIKSALRVRWDLSGSELFPGVLAAGMLVALSLAGFHLARDTVDYWRIRLHHESTVGVITSIYIDHSGKHDSTYASVGYSLPNGQKHRLRHEVRGDFPSHCKVGDKVTIEFLPTNPSVARIQDWDLDGAQWVFLIFLFPLLFIVGIGTRGMVDKWLFPLSTIFRWSSSHDQTPSPIVSINDARLFSLNQALPERHRGAMFLKPKKGKGEPTVNGLASQLRKAGIECKCVIESYVALDRANAGHLIERLADDDSYEGRYGIVDMQTAEEVEKYLVQKPETAPGEIEITALTDARFVRWPGLAPLDDQSKRALFERWIMLRLARLYGGALPATTVDARFAALFGVQPEQGTFTIMVQRRASGPRVWLRSADEPSAQLATLERGRWTLYRDQALPTGLKPARSMLMWLLFFLPMLPLLLVVVAVTLLMHPLFAWAARDEQKKVERARAAATISAPSPGAETNSPIP